MSPYSMRLKTKTTTQPLDSAHFADAHSYSLTEHMSLASLTSFTSLRSYSDCCFLSATGFSHSDIAGIQPIMCCHSNNYGLTSVASGGSDGATVEPKEYFAASTDNITADEDVPAGKLLLLSSWLWLYLRWEELKCLTHNTRSHSGSQDADRSQPLKLL